MMEARAIETLLRDEWRELTRESGPGAPSPLSLPPSSRLPLRRPALFAQLEELRTSWLDLEEAIDAHSERFVNPGWRLRELVAHLASWAREFRQEVETVAAGRGFDYAIPFALSVLGPVQWNEERVAERSNGGVRDQLRELDEETSRLQDLVLEIDDGALYGTALFPHAPSGDPAERWRGSCAMVTLGRCQHDWHHLAQVRQRLAAWGDSG